MDELSLCTFQYMDGPFSNISRGGARNGFQVGLTSGQNVRLAKIKLNSTVFGSSYYRFT